MIFDIPSGTLPGGRSPRGQGRSKPPSRFALWRSGKEKGRSTEYGFLRTSALTSESDKNPPMPLPGLRRTDPSLVGRSPRDRRQRRDVRNSTQSSFVRKTANLTVEAKYDCAHVWCIIHAAHTLIRFPQRLLAAPLTRQNFESAPLFFCSIGRCGRLVERVEQKEGDKEWLSNVAFAAG